MKTNRRSALEWIWLYALLGAIVLPACAGKKTEDAEPTTDDTAAVSGSGADSGLDETMDRAKLEREFAAVLFEKRMSQARAHRKSGNIEDALRAVEDALARQPGDAEAIMMQAEMRAQLGGRAGSVAVQMDELDQDARVRHDAQVAQIRKHIDIAESKMNQNDFRSARRGYEDALFIVNTAPVRSDDLTALGASARQGLDDVGRAEDIAEQEATARNTDEALRRIALQEEKSLMEGKDRRQRLLSAAIDRFNLEDFEQAEEYARQVLQEEPDNTVARQIVDNARAAQHTYNNKKNLSDLKENFRQWKVDIERTKVPQGSILQWPSQKFWDNITRLRAVSAGGGGGANLSPEEQNVANTLKTRRIDLPFTEATPFPQLVQYLNAASGINFVTDARAKEDLDAVEVTIEVQDVTVEDGLALIMRQVSAEGEIVYEIIGNVVRFIKKENQAKNLTLHVHPVADLTLPLTDFIPPQITQVGVDDDSEEPLFGGTAEEAQQPYGTIDELMELVRNSVAPESWEENATISAQAKNLVVWNTPDVQQQIAIFLDDLRAFAGLVVTIEARFLTVGDAFLRDVGVDFRGLGGTNAGTLAVLDDVTSGLDDNASAALDNSGPGLGAGGAATNPSSGIFFNDGSDGDFRSRTENVFVQPLGSVLSALGGGTFQVTFLDDVELSAILRATEKKIDSRELTAPVLTVYNTQRANITVVNQINFIQDFDVEVAQTSFIADPVIGVIQDGLTLDVRPTVSHDRQFITLELRPTVTDLVTPIATFQTLLGASIGAFSAQSPVTIQLPELDIRTAESTIRMPDRGSVLMGGLKDILFADKKSSTPILGNIPILGFLFSRQGKSEEVTHLMIIVTATITDLQEQAQRRVG
ncbi:MAG: hypothetical protein V3T86_01700 [Planctomycetota bacterium]